MSQDAMDILSRYTQGFFPLYDLDGRFYWERLSIRAVLPLTPAVLGRARRMARRIRTPFLLRHTTAVEEIIAHLRREEVKEHSWVQAEVVEIYRTLLRANILETLEAWDPAGERLLGALVGIRLPGTFIAETMFGLVPEASKFCLCRLIEQCHQEGVAMIDVQTPHDPTLYGNPAPSTPHPCIRLGEELLPLGTFLRSFQAAWKRAFAGDLAEWIESRKRR